MSTNSLAFKVGAVASFCQNYLVRATNSITNETVANTI